MNIFYTGKHVAYLAAKDDAARAERVTQGKSGKASAARQALAKRMKDMAKGIGFLLQSRMKCTKKEVCIDSLFFDAEKDCLFVNAKLMGEKTLIRGIKAAEAAPKIPGETQKARHDARARYVCTLESGMASQYFLDSLASAIQYWLHENADSVFLKPEI